MALQWLQASHPLREVALKQRKNSKQTKTLKANLFVCWVPASKSFQHFIQQKLFVNKPRTALITWRDYGDKHTLMYITQVLAIPCEEMYTAQVVSITSQLRAVPYWKFVGSRMCISKSDCNFLVQLYSERRAHMLKRKSSELLVSVVPCCASCRIMWLIIASLAPA